MSSSSSNNHKKQKQKRRPRQRQAVRFNDSVISDPKTDMVLRNYWTNKYSVLGLSASLNGGTPGQVFSLSSNTSQPNIYALDFSFGDILQSIITNGTINFQRARLQMVRFKIRPRIKEFVQTNSVGTLQPPTDPFFWIMHNPEGYRPTSINGIISGMRSSRHSIYKDYSTTIRNLRVQQAVTDYVLSANVYQTIPAPWIDLENVGTAPYPFQALEHQGLVVAFPQAANQALLFDFDVEYIITWKDKTGAF